ncbi:hypothetical protein AK812_SmicGene929 [Symbiodinium microadriaticum]|uniref:Uncharacterized protein n=1 Tax=Symbiodinium microadriaticum TaxID=2951 RepID=A0A1Q9F5H5_SYMMI|nr:hypothetical protein AK812_SmicGene929 [Symbiodinium microadriaticum]
MGRDSRSQDGPPPIPMLYQGFRLSLEAFEDAYGTLEDFIIFEALGDSNESLGYAIGRINRFFPTEEGGAHIELSYLGCENSFYRWYIEHEGEPGGLPRGWSHHLCRRSLTTCCRKEGRKMVHVQKWGPITKENAHTLLVAWGYTGFADLGRKPPLSRRSGSGAAPAATTKKAGKKPAALALEPEEAEVVDDDEDEAEEPPRRRGRKRHRGSAALEQETANVLDGMMSEAAKDEGLHPSGGGPLEARLKGLKAKLHEKTKSQGGGAAKVLAEKAQAAASSSKPRAKSRRSGEVVTALKKALLPRGRARDSEEVAEDSYSEGDEDDDGLGLGRGGSSLVAKRRQLRRYAQEHPGHLLCKGLENMREQVGEIFGDEELNEDKYAPVVNRYLLSVLLPNYPAKHQHEDRLREMRTLALGLDMILRGKIDGAADLFMQRFKSLSMALRDGDPRYGRYLELLPEDLIGGGATQGETEYARTMALKAAKSEALMKKGLDAATRAVEVTPEKSSYQGPTGEEDATQWSTRRRSPCQLRGGQPEGGEERSAGLGGDGPSTASSSASGRREPKQMEGQGLRAPQEGPVRELVDEDGAPSDRPGWAAPVEFSLPGLGRPLPQTGAHTLAQSLGDLFQLLDVAPEVTFNALAGQVVTSVECQHRLQLGITLLQLLLLSLRDRGHFCNFMELLQTITPLAGGTQKQGAGIRQRDLLPLPIPAFGALLNLVKKHKRPGSGVIIWRVAEARKVGKQQLKKSVSAACFQTWRLLSVITLNGMGTGWEKLAPASGHVVTRSQTLALESLARRCAWWSGSPLEERPPGDFSDLIRSRQVDYTGDAVLKALPLRLEELAPGLPEDGVAGSLDASSIADETVKCWVDDPDVALLDPSAWPHPLPSASMNVSVSEWERIVAVLYNKGIVAPIEAEEIFHVNGVPVLNGVFAVEKGGEPLPGECRVTRLIMNLVPANSLQKLMPGDLPTLAGSSNWSGIHLLPNEVLLWSGDDQKGAFYAWKLPKAWRKLMAFKMPVPGRLVGRPDIPYIHVASAVIPMGWVNAVSLFQHLHRRAGLAAEPVGAGLDPSNEWRRDKPIPRGAVDAGGMWFQYYLDDFDCPEKVAKHTWKTMVNTMSPTQAKQRLSYDRIGIGISEKKAHVREPCVVRMGAEVDGVAGLLSAPRLKILETGWLLVWALGRPVLSARMKMVLLGRLTRCFEFRRPLMCLLNKCWPKSMWCRATPLPSGHAFELITAGALLCLAVMDLRTPVSGLVTCSDASTMGGGMCVSAGLTDAGEKLLMKLDAAPFDTECMKPQGSIQQPSRGGPRVLVLSLFDGVSAVMCGLTRLPCAVQGYAMSADDPDELRLSRTRFPGVIQLGKPQKVDAEIISKLLTSVGNRLDFVLLSAAATRSFFASDVSDPFFEICRIFDLLQHLSLVPVHLMVENLGNIPSRDVDAFNKALGCKPYLVDSKYFTWVERPRLFWISWDVHPLPGLAGRSVMLMLRCSALSRIF